MYIVVIGGGRVGYYLTRALISESHEVLIIEKDPKLCQVLTDELGSICLRGDGCETSVQAEAGTGRADMLIAVTGDDEDNLVACQLAKHKFNVPLTISRIRNPQNEVLFKKLGVDVTVSSTNIILESIEREVPTHPLTHLLDIKENGLEVVDIRIQPDSVNVGKPIKELQLPPQSTLCLVIRKEHKPVVPNEDTILEAEDQIIAVTPPAIEEKLRTALRGS